MGVEGQLSTAPLTLQRTRVLPSPILHCLIQSCCSRWVWSFRSPLDSMTVRVEESRMKLQITPPPGGSGGWLITGSGWSCLVWGIEALTVSTGWKWKISSLLSSLMVPWLADQRVSCFHGAGNGRPAPLLALLTPLGGGIREPPATTSYLLRPSNIASWGKSEQCHLLMQTQR